MSSQRGQGPHFQPDALAAPGRAEDGPVMDRLKFLLGAVVAAVVGVVLLLGLTTVHSLYRGSRAGWFGPPERVAVAEVRSCRRLGPLSLDGLGYWWECAVTVRVADGRVVNAVVDRSVVTPADIGREVELRQGCKGRGLTDCNYGRPVARGWKVAVGALLIVEWSVLVLSVFMVVMYLLRAVLGRQGYAALYNRYQRLQRPQRASR